MDGMRAELIEALRWGERMDGEPERPAEEGRTRSQRAGGGEGTGEEFERNCGDGENARQNFRKSAVFRISRLSELRVRKAHRGESDLPAGGDPLRCARAGQTRR